MIGTQTVAMASDGFQPPEALLQNVKDMLDGCSDEDARMFLEVSVFMIAQAYDSRRYKVFWTKLDCQALAFMLSDATFASFAQEHGELAMQHMEEHEGFVNSLSDVQRSAFENLGMWLTYALQPHKRLSDWKKAAHAFHMNADIDALTYMCKPLLKLAQAHVVNVATVLRRDYGDATDDGRRIMVRDGLFEHAHDDADYAIVDIVADSMLYADKKLSPQQLSDRIQLQREELKAIILKRRADATTSTQ